MRKAIMIERDSAMHLLLSFYVCCILGTVLASVVIPGQMLSPPPYSLLEIGCMVVITLAGYCAQASLTFASKNVEGGLVCLVNSSDVIWAYFWHIFFFGEEAHWYSLMGAFLIVMSVVVIGLQKMHAHRRREPRIDSNTRDAAPTGPVPVVATSIPPIPEAKLELQPRGVGGEPRWIRVVSDASQKASVKSLPDMVLT